ncbi:unnamed protein product, partial [Closterium sp. Naga37s-1]
RCCHLPLPHASFCSPLATRLRSSPFNPSFISRAMARMTAVTMLLPGLLAGIVLGVAIAAVTIINILPLGRDAWHATTAKSLTRGTGNQTVNHPLMPPPPSVQCHSCMSECHKHAFCSCSCKCDLPSARPRSRRSLSLPPHPVSRCISSARGLFYHHHSHCTAVGDGCDPHASQSMGASAGLGCDGWADEAEECNHVPPATWNLLSARQPR